MKIRKALHTLTAAAMLMSSTASFAADMTCKDLFAQRPPKLALAKPKDALPAMKDLTPDEQIRLRTIKEKIALEETRQLEKDVKDIQKLKEKVDKLRNQTGRFEGWKLTDARRKLMVFQGLLFISDARLATNSISTLFQNVEMAKIDIQFKRAKIVDLQIKIAKNQIDERTFREELTKLKAEEELLVRELDRMYEDWEPAARLLFDSKAKNKAVDVDQVMRDVYGKDGDPVMNAALDKLQGEPAKDAAAPKDQAAAPADQAAPADAAALKAKELEEILRLVEAAKAKDDKDFLKTVLNAINDNGVQTSLYLKTVNQVLHDLGNYRKDEAVVAKYKNMAEQLQAMSPEARKMVDSLERPTLEQLETFIEKERSNASAQRRQLEQEISDLRKFKLKRLVGAPQVFSFIEGTITRLVPEKYRAAAFEVFMFSYDNLMRDRHLANILLILRVPRTGDGIDPMTQLKVLQELNARYGNDELMITFARTTRASEDWINLRKTAKLAGDQPEATLWKSFYDRMVKAEEKAQKMGEMSLVYDPPSFTLTALFARVGIIAGGSAAVDYYMANQHTIMEKATDWLHYSIQFIPGIGG